MKIKHKIAGNTLFEIVGANLIGADLRGANLKDAGLDFSSGLPMWCGGLKVNIDDRIAIQLLYHALSNIKNSNTVSEKLKVDLINDMNTKYANMFHKIDEVGKL